jgi:hypothetical protein
MSTTSSTSSCATSTATTADRRFRQTGETCPPFLQGGVSPVCTAGTPASERPPSATTRSPPHRPAAPPAQRPHPALATNESAADLALQRHSRWFARTPLPGMAGISQWKGWARPAEPSCRSRATPFTSHTTTTTAAADGSRLNDCRPRCRTGTRRSAASPPAHLGRWTSPAARTARGSMPAGLPSASARRARTAPRCRPAC